MIVLKNIKKMSKIPTVEEFYKQTTGCVMNHRDIKTAMIEFAKLHVKLALKQASENVIIDGHPFEYELDKDSILNAYPLENIK